MDDVEVRLADDSELREIAALRWTWLVQERGGRTGTDREAFLDGYGEWARAHAATHRCFVAAAGERLIGTAWLALTPRVPAPGALDRLTGDLQSVFVLEAFRGRGVGARLVAAAIDAARASGAERVVVHSSERAVGLYARAGLQSSELLRDRTLSGR